MLLRINQLDQMFRTAGPLTTQQEILPATLRLRLGRDHMVPAIISPLQQRNKVPCRSPACSNSSSRRSSSTRLDVVLTPRGGFSSYIRATSHMRLRARDHFHFKHSHWWKRRSRSKFTASHYNCGTNGACECKMDVKSTWILTWHQMDHVLWSLGLFSKTSFCR